MNMGIGECVVGTTAANKDVLAQRYAYHVRLTRPDDRGHQDSRYSDETEKRGLLRIEWWTFLIMNTTVLGEYKASSDIDISP